MGGYLALYREIYHKPIWLKSSPEQKVVLIAILGMANFKENEWEWKGEKFKVNPGQFITSLDKIITKCGRGISIQNVRSALLRFEKLEFLTNESTKTGRLLTIVNWGLYQDTEPITNKATNKEVTKNQQRGNKELTPKNKVKKVKKDDTDNNSKKDIVKKKLYSDSVKLTDEQYEKLIKEFGEVDTKDKIETLSLYVKSSGKIYKCHYSTILNWDRKDKKKAKEKPIINKQTKGHEVNYDQRPYTKEDFTKFEQNEWMKKNN